MGFGRRKSLEERGEESIVGNNTSKKYKYKKMKGIPKIHLITISKMGASWRRINISYRQTVCVSVSVPVKKQLRGHRRESRAGKVNSKRKKRNKSSTKKRAKYRERNRIN